MSTDQSLHRIAQWLREASSAVAFTGAGISTDSGIPDFRSPGGVWAKNTPVYYQQFIESPQARNEYWRQKFEAHRDFQHAQPNLAHQLLARWESANTLRGVVTQNIDGLHQAAGNRHVLELHGTAREVECIDCQQRFSNDLFMDEFARTRIAPFCPQCRGRVKSATVLFGQALPDAVWRQSIDWIQNADLVLAIGSSLVVEPAASLPRMAHERGAHLVIINRDTTPLDQRADAVVRQSISETLQQIDRLAFPS
jgi:NAD-dependent deacetylase